jgi:hypothetical protein
MFILCESNRRGKMNGTEEKFVITNPYEHHIA